MPGYRQAICGVIGAGLVLATGGAGPYGQGLDTLNVRNLALPYDRGAIFVLPSERLSLSYTAPASRLHALDAPDGRLLATGPNRWTWQAPAAPGDYEVELRDPEGKDTIELTAMVMVPSARVQHGLLGGYRIGAYPPAENRKPLYQPPKGFIQVTRDNEDTRVSPNFRLKQFLSKQESGYPKYLVLDERLVFVLEAAGQRLEPLGYEADDIHVMSGYRTPFYNKAIDNVAYSLHQWGRAADIFVDKDGNGRMDDLNKDRRVDRLDAVFLSDLLEELSKVPDLKPLIGGLGVYDATAAHGPFVHVDTRDGRARW